MKNVLLKTTVLLIAAVSIGALSFKLYHSKNARSAQSGFDGLNKLHEVYLGTTQDRCRGTKRVSVLNEHGGYEPIPNDGTIKVVDVNVNTFAGYWKWKCGTFEEKSRITGIPVQVTRLKVTHNNGLIIFRCYNHR